MLLQVQKSEPPITSSRWYMGSFSSCNLRVIQEHVITEELIYHFKMRFCRCRLVMSL